MKKKYFVMAVAAVFALATVCSCGKSKGNKEKDDTEEVEDDEDDEESVREYLSQDLATFDLYGQVLTVSYDDGDNVSVMFNPSGTVEQIMKIDSEGSVETGTIDRDGNERIQFISFESDEPWITSLGYDDDADGFVSPVSYMSTNTMGNYSAYNYQRDSNGKVTGVEYEEAVHGSIIDDTSEYTISFSDYDEQGNWRKCSITTEDYTQVIKRKISYFNDNDDEDENADADDDETIKDFITEMYENQMYYDEDFLEEHCTKKLLKYLKDNYEYDGEGYAGWLFRTSAQDGKPDAEPTPDEVIKVWSDGDGWYNYQFTDGGWSGENRVKCTVENGKVMMSELQRVYDEAYEEYNQ